MIDQKKSFNHKSEAGAVSLFIVIFTSLLVTTITISFMQLMTKDQQQATFTDLSGSAYDSALAGVEDAKRALLMQQDCQGNNSSDCDNVRNAIDAGQCTTLSAIFGGSSAETPIMQTVGDRKLEQAYTCVKIKKNTSDYVGSIESDAVATLIPLRAEAAFNKVVISWGLSKSGGAVSLGSGTKDLPPTGTASWPENRPALLRTQLIHGGDSFRLSDFDSTGFSNTLFMYPSNTGSNSFQFALDGRRGAFGSEPQLVLCDSNPSSGAYACKMTIDINPAVAANSQTVFLNLIALYNRTDYKIELMNDSSTVRFDGVQPEIDSTGRANDLFRRVVSRVEINNSFNYPVAALEVKNSICKNFSVTPELADYSESATCLPTN